MDIGPARGDESGTVGPVSVAATGRLVAVAWSDRGATLARVSIDAGGHWGNPTPLLERASSAAAADSRLAFGGTSKDGAPAVSIWTESEAWRALAVPEARLAPSTYHGAAVALGPATSLAVTYLASCPAEETQPAGDTRWTNSPDGGVTWRALPPLPRCAGGSPILWRSDGRAFLLFYGDESYVLAVHP